MWFLYDFVWVFHPHACPPPSLKAKTNHLQYCMQHPVLCTGWGGWVGRGECATSHFCRQMGSPRAICIANCKELRGGPIRAISRPQNCKQKWNIIQLGVGVRLTYVIFQGMNTPPPPTPSPPPSRNAKTNHLHYCMQDPVLYTGWGWWGGRGGGATSCFRRQTWSQRAILYDLIKLLYDFIWFVLYFTWFYLISYKLYMILGHFYMILCDFYMILYEYSIPTPTPHLV